MKHPGKRDKDQDTINNDYESGSKSKFLTKIPMIDVLRRETKGDKAIF